MKRIFGALLTAVLATTLVAAPQAAADKDQPGATGTEKKKTKKQAKQKGAKHAGKTTEAK